MTKTFYLASAQTAEILSDGSGIRLTRNGAGIYLRTTGQMLN